MSINLGEVFTTFATKYDKQNILSYVAILFFLCLGQSLEKFLPFGRKPLSPPIIIIT